MDARIKVAAIGALVVGTAILLATVTAEEPQPERYSVDIDTSDMPEGTQTISVYAVDNYGNISEAGTVEVYIDHYKETSMTIVSSRENVYLERSTNSVNIKSYLMAEGSKVATRQPDVSLWGKTVGGEWEWLRAMRWYTASKSYQYLIYPLRTTIYKVVFDGNSDFGKCESEPTTVTVWKEVH